MAADPDFDPQPITLEGQRVRLEPLDLCHARELHQAAQDDEIWRYMPIRRPQALEETEGWIAQALMELESRSQLPFAIIDRSSGSAVGSSRYLDIQREHRGLEVGWTWLALSAQRTGINTECKFLLLQHAFEPLGAVRVQLKTDSRNVRSQTAIKRIGAHYEGTLRQHRLVWDGHRRDSVYFSIIDSEWPEVRLHLERLLKRER